MFYLMAQHLLTLGCALVQGACPLHWYIGNVTGLQTHVGWCYGWLRVWVWDASLQPSPNPYLWHGFDGSRHGLMGLLAFAGQCDWVTHGHTIPLAWFSPTTTFTTHHPSCSQLQPTAHTCPSPLQGMWAGLFLLNWGVWQEEHKGGCSKWEAQLVCHENGPWLMAHSRLSLFPGPQLMPLPRGVRSTDVGHRLPWVGGGYSHWLHIAIGQPEALAHLSLMCHTS